MSSPSSSDSILTDLEEPQEDCTVPEDILTELGHLQESFINLVEDIESETETRVKNGTVKVDALVSRIMKKAPYAIKEKTAVKTTDEFFQAISPFYTFLDCQLILHIVLYISLSGSIADKAEEYGSQIARFKKSTKVKYLQRILKRCHFKYRKTNRKIVIAAQGLWGLQTILLVEQLVGVLFPQSLYSNHSELQWFEVIPGSIIMTFIISKHMILPFLKKSKKKLEFMRLMGVISLKIGDEFVMKSDGENGVFSFENSLIEATMVDNIEAVEFLLQYVQVSVNIKNTNSSLLNSRGNTMKKSSVEYFLRHHHTLFIAIMKDIERELHDLMNEIEMTNSSAVDKLQSLSIRAMDEWTNEILCRDNFLSGQLLATSKFLSLSDSMLKRINQYNDCIEAVKRQSLILQLHKPLEEYFHNPFPDTVKATITLPIVWSNCSVWLVEQLIQLIVSPGHLIEFQLFRVINNVESFVVIFLIPADLVIELIIEIMKNLESARLLGFMEIEIDDITVLHYGCNIEYNFDKGIDQARKKADEKVVDILVRVNQIPVGTDSIRITTKDGNDNFSFVQHHDSTPLMIACCNDNSQLVKLLLQYKADPNIEDIGKVTALMYGTGNSTIFKMLLDHGADLNATDIFKNTMMHYACMIGNVRVVEIILSRNRDLINKINTNGKTPLMAASYSGHLAVVKRLLKEHADPNIQTIYGSTPLLCASIEGHLLVVQELLHHHADPNIQMSNGTTPLLLVSAQGHLSIIVQLLLQSGADPTLKHHDTGDTALDIAVRKDHSEIIDILRKALKN